MQEQDPEKPEIDLLSFAKALWFLLTFIFWLLCIGIGYFIANDEKGKSIILLLTLGAFLPIAARAAIGLIQEKYSGQEMDAKDMHVPIFCTFVFLMAFYYIIYLGPEIISAIMS